MCDLNVTEKNIQDLVLKLCNKYMAEQWYSAMEGSGLCLTTKDVFLSKALARIIIYVFQKDMTLFVEIQIKLIDAARNRSVLDDWRTFHCSKTTLRVK